jgi:hypothetical protein
MPKLVPTKIEMNIPRYLDWHAVICTIMKPLNVYKVRPPIVFACILDIINTRACSPNSLQLINRLLREPREFLLRWLSETS